MSPRARILAAAAVTAVVIVCLGALASPAVSFAAAAVPVLTKAAERLAYYTAPAGGWSAPAGRAAPSPASIDACAVLVHVDFGGAPEATLFGAQSMTDSGPAPGAQGTVHRDEHGRIQSYTVASGDVRNRVEDRLCVSRGTIALHNDISGRMLRPGEVLRLRPLPPAEAGAVDG